MTQPPSPLTMLLSRHTRRRDRAQNDALKSDGILSRTPSRPFSSIGPPSLYSAAEADDQNQGREPEDRDEAKPQNGFCCSLTGCARRGVVRASCFFVSFFGSSEIALFATSGAGSVAAAIGSASDGVGGTQGESA